MAVPTSLLCFSSLLYAQSSLQLEYSTYLGGNNTEFLNGIDLDSADNIYICGSTHATNFPTVKPYQESPGGDNSDGFIAKFSSLGSVLFFSTYLGGDDNDSVDYSVIDQVLTVGIVSAHGDPGLLFELYPQRKYYAGMYSFNLRRYP